MQSRLSARRAAWIGVMWVNGSVLAAYGLGFALLAWVIVSNPELLSRLGPWSLLFFLLALVWPWLIWSVQVTRWRLWAYPRVSDLDALKAQAVALGVIWPSGHWFEKTEWRTRNQALELERFEPAKSSAQNAT